MASVSFSDEEPEMYPYISVSDNLDPHDAIDGQTQVGPTTDNDNPSPEAHIQGTAASTLSLDLLNHIPGMFRLLDLITEQSFDGSGTTVSDLSLFSYAFLVDRILLAHESLSDFANFIKPGSYRSITKVRPSVH